MPDEPQARRNLGDILTSLNLINEEQVQAALALQRENGKLFGECLLELGCVAEDDVSWALSSQLGYPFVSAQADLVDRDLLDDFPRDFLRRNLVLPLVASEDSLSVVLADPTDQVTLARLRRITGRKLEVAVATPRAIRQALDESLGTAPHNELDAPGLDAGEPDLEAGNIATLASPELMRLLDRMLSQGASAAFLDPEDDKIRVRFLVAGGLREEGIFDPKAMSDLVESLKGWMGDAEEPVTGVRVWGVANTNPAEMPIRATTVRGRRGVSVTLTVDGLDGSNEKVSAPYEPEWERFDELLRRPKGFVAAVAPTEPERRHLLGRILGQMDLSRRRGWVLAPSDLDLPKRLPCFQGPTTLAAAAAFSRMDGLGLVAGLFPARAQASVLAEAGARDRFVAGVFPGSSALGFISRLLEDGVPHSLLSESLLAVAAQRIYPGEGKGERPQAITEILFVDEPVRRALQDGGRIQELRAAAAEQEFVELAARARALNVSDTVLIKDLERHRYLEDAA